MIHLLLINISEEHATSIIEMLETNNTEVDYLILDDETELNQELIDATYWDAIILSESPSQNFSLLTSVADQFNDTPIIFFTKDYSDQLFTDVMKHGAKDCISDSEYYRLPPILQRELSANRFSDTPQKLTESPEILSEIVDLSTNDVFLFDTQDFTCCYANQTAISNLRYSKSELMSMTALDIYSEYEGDSFSMLIYPMLQNRHDEIAICTNISRKMGAVYPAEVRFKKINHEGKTHILAINKDISDTWYKVRKLKRQRSLTNNYITKHKQKEELLANAAHDMRTSLQSIILSNKLLFDKQPGDFKQGFGKFQKAIHFSGKHLLNYINEFFDPSPTTGKNNTTNLTADSLDLKSFTQKLFLVFKPIAQRNDITFHFKNAELDHQHISTNQTYVKRILKNLLSNAFKFTNEGSVTFEIFSLPASTLENTQIDTDQAIAFKIQDTGIGIPKNQLKSVFERHKRTKNTKQGSGLGLHICQELSKSLGGEIDVKSNVEEGSTFILYLPVQKTESPAISHKKNGHTSQKKAIQNQDKTILIIDDSEVHNLAIKEYLNYTFEKCITVDTLPKARDVLDNTEIDCIVSDYTIYGDSCLGFLQEIRNNQRFSGIPTIVYTGKKLTDTERESILSYADTIVKKSAGSYDTLTHTIISFFRKNNQSASSLVK
ncbi:ATP-binding protein [Fodinibius sp. N2]|uniref:ATP-binding protein n=1 Tax=Fodinibius alkaliphilus TaxID=3140241 RepID=UPI00315A5662